MEPARRIARFALGGALLWPLAVCETPAVTVPIQPTVIPHAAAKIPLNVALLIRPGPAVVMEDRTSSFCKTDYDLSPDRVSRINVSGTFGQDARLAFAQAFLSVWMVSSLAQVRNADAIFELYLKQVTGIPGCGSSTSRSDVIDGSLRALSADGQERWRSAISSKTMVYEIPRTKSLSDALNSFERKSSQAMAELLDSWIEELRALETERYVTLDRGYLAMAVAAGTSAEQSGNPQAALAIYTSALQRYPKTAGFASSLATRAIDIALRIDPPPAIPEDARRHAAHARAAIEAAKQTLDLETAQSEYYQALALAPWWADVYADLAAVLERLDRSGEAAQALKLYMRAAPKAPDRAAMETKLNHLEFKDQQQRR